MTMANEQPTPTWWRRALLRCARWFLRRIDREIDLRPNETAVLRGHAEMDRGAYRFTGLFVLTSDRVVYRPLKGQNPIALTGRPPHPIDLPLNSIVDASEAKEKRSVLNPFPRVCLAVMTMDGQTYVFGVVHPEEWVRRIKQAVGNLP
jgi:hypothetical protein